MGVTTLVEMKGLLEVALKAVRLDDVKVEIDENEEFLRVAGDTISVALCEIEKETLAGKRTFPAWEVLWWTYTPGGVPNWNDPPDCSEKELYRGLSPYDAATRVVLALHEDRLHAAFENLECESVP